VCDLSLNAAFNSQNRRNGSTCRHNGGSAQCCAEARRRSQRSVRRQTRVKMVDFYPIVVGFIVSIWALEFYLQLRQHACFDTRQLTKELHGKIPVDKFERSQAYGKAKSWFALVQSVFDLGFTLVVLHCGLIKATWDLAGRLNANYLALDESHEIARSLTFVVLSQAAATVFQLPFNLYSTFVIEDKFGFNKQTLRLYAVDAVKMIAVQLALGLPVLSGLLLVIKWGGDQFWLYAWLLIFVLVLVFLTIFPYIQVRARRVAESLRHTAHRRCLTSSLSWSVANCVMALKRWQNVLNFPW
jgi:hypothetical protein